MSTTHAHNTEQRPIHAVVPIFEERPKQNCLALLAVAGLLWCTEALPLFVTSMLVPLLAVVMRVLVDDGARLSAPDAAKRIFGAMFSQASPPC